MKVRVVDLTTCACADAGACACECACFGKNDDADDGVGTCCADDCGVDWD